MTRSGSGGGIGAAVRACRPVSLPCECRGVASASPGRATQAPPVGLGDAEIGWPSDLTVCERSFAVTGPGHADTRFKRALKSGNAHLALDAAAELQRISDGIGRHNRS